jgi:hypothetical protein
VGIEVDIADVEVGIADVEVGIADVKAGVIEWGIEVDVVEMDVVEMDIVKVWMLSHLAGIVTLTPNGNAPPSRGCFTWYYDFLLHRDI